MEQSHRVWLDVSAFIAKIATSDADIIGSIPSLISGAMNDPARVESNTVPALVRVGAGSAPATTFTLATLTALGEPSVGTAVPESSHQIVAPVDRYVVTAKNSEARRVLSQHSTTDRRVRVPDLGHLKHRMASAEPRAEDTISPLATFRAEWRSSRFGERAWR